MTSALATTLLHDPNPLVRRSAAEGLHPDACTDEGERSAAIESLACALNDPHVAVQEAAMSALVTFESCHVARHLLPVLHGTVQHRNVAIEVLQRLGPTALPVLFRAVPDSDKHIRNFIVDLVIGFSEALSGVNRLFRPIPWNKTVMYGKASSTVAATYTALASAGLASPSFQGVRRGDTRAEGVSIHSPMSSPIPTGAPVPSTISGSVLEVETES